MDNSINTSLHHRVKCFTTFYSASIFPVISCATLRTKISSLGIQVVNYGGQYVNPYSIVSVYNVQGGAE